MDELIAKNSTVSYIIKHSGEQIPIGSHSSIVNGERVCCESTICESSHNKEDLFIQKVFSFNGKVLASRTDFLKKSAIKGYVKDGVYTPVISLF